MEIISIANLKGGVGKSTTAINLADNLARKGYKVLLIDNDKQGNTSEFFNLLDENQDGTHTILLESEVDVTSLIQKTKYENLDVMPTNMLMQFADSNTKNDMIVPPQQKYKLALEQVKNDYDYCVIDNAPSLDISVINSLVCANKILITMKVDNFSRMGLKILAEQLESIRKYYNPQLNDVYILYTMCNNSNVSKQGQQLIDDSLDDITPNIKYSSFDTCIRRTVVVDESTFAKEPLSIYNTEASATIDYEKLTDEILSKDKFKIVEIDIDKIIPNENNFYKIEEVENLKDSIIELGLQHNLIVSKKDENGKYKIISGHRRYKAIQELIADGKLQIKTLPCKIENKTELEQRPTLIVSNSTSK